MATTNLPMYESGIDRAHRRVIFASSLGTVFEWYDFYLYGSLAAIISKQFFSGVNETTGFIFALLAFAAGFAVRPFGALLFGRLGDMVGRKYTFLITIVIMGLATALVGILPSYAQIGVAAPVTLIALRLLQGLALGGEYGGAATYVGEHAPPGRRGLYTSWIQTTATLGLFLSLLVILVCRSMLGEEFDTWGWRIPFLVSIALLVVSVYIRLQLAESPVFLEMKESGTRSKAPLTESFARWGNLRLVILALLGATAGQAVVWYCGQFYALFFLTQVLKVDAQPANLLIAAALVIGTPFFIVFGRLSDRIGRKKIVLAGCLIAALTYVPIFKGITHFANPAIESAAATSPVTVVADPSACAFQFDPVGKKKFVQSCDVAKAALAKAGVPYNNEAAAVGSVALVRVGTTEVPSVEGGRMSAAEFKDATAKFAKTLTGTLKAAGYPPKADPARINYPMVLLLLVILVIYVTMVYGPIAAWLVELFPARIRYTSMSLPYHIGNGWFGGFLPTVSFALVALTGDIYYGLWYPIIVALMTVVIGSIFLPETKDRHVQYPH
ncbi:MAG TPA: MFS transporter [Steroidobacteraceae bacterium]|nr:MFS transporter [Steroidobacteraceae bacterium]